MSDELDWKKAIEDYDNRRLKEKKSKKRKNKKSKIAPPRVKIVQGGQTGLVQQNLISRPSSGPSDKSMIE